MTATKRLRALLDERGVEWTYADGTVSFNDGKHWYHAWAYNDGSMVVSMGYLTPEQAIAATLGRGTCKYDFVPNIGNGFLNACGLKCSYCGREQMSMEAPKFCPECGRKVER